MLSTYGAFSDELGSLVQRFFDESWIDAPVRPNKRGGAFCAYTVPSSHPYVLLNYTHTRRDVLTLAHELGHGVHAALGARQGIFHMATPLTMAETASVFGETLVFGRLLEQTGTPESRLALLAESIEGSIATVFRQIAMNRFEHLVHTERRERGELAVERIGELWAESQTELLGDAVEVTEGYRSWWSYVPHFISTPGYVYAYAYGQLLALAVYGRYEEQGESFVPAYLDLLKAGGSRSPEELGQIVGVDLADPGFWDRGLDIVERQLDAAEEAAREANRRDLVGEGLAAVVGDLQRAVDQRDVELPVLVDGHRLRLAAGRPAVLPALAAVGADLDGSAGIDPVQRAVLGPGEAHVRRRVDLAPGLARVLRDEDAALGAADPLLRVPGIDLERDQRQRRGAGLPRLALVAGHEHLRLLEQRRDDVVAGELDRVEVGLAEL